MSIQPSVLIWTVICFCVFAFVLNVMLFKPLHRVMDKREAKISAAEKRAKELADRKAEQSRLKEEADKAAKAEHEAAARARLSEFARVSQQELKNAKLENENKLEIKRNELRAAKAENEKIIDGSLDNMIAAFTEKLVSYR